MTLRHNMETAGAIKIFEERTLEINDFFLGRTRRPYALVHQWVDYVMRGIYLEVDILDPDLVTPLEPLLYSPTTYIPDGVTHRTVEPGEYNFLEALKQKLDGMTIGSNRLICEII